MTANIDDHMTVILSHQKHGLFLRDLAVTAHFISSLRALGRPRAAGDQSCQQAHKKSYSISLFHLQPFLDQTSKPEAADEWLFPQRFSVWSIPFYRLTVKFEKGVFLSKRVRWMVYRFASIFLENTRIIGYTPYKNKWSLISKGGTEYEDQVKLYSEVGKIR